MSRRGDEGGASFPGDPIASPTLSRLYMSQGHWGRARSMLESIVARDPTDGDALALLARLGGTGGRVSTKRDGNDLVVRWQGLPARGHHVVAVTTREHRGRVRTGVTSVPCREAFGEVRFALPSQRGSLAACAGRVDAEQGFVAIAIAPPLSWD